MPAQSRSRENRNILSSNSRRPSSVTYLDFHGIGPLCGERGRGPQNFGGFRPRVSLSEGLKVNPQRVWQNLEFLSKIRCEIDNFLVFIAKPPESSTKKYKKGGFSGLFGQNFMSFLHHYPYVFVTLPGNFPKDGNLGEFCRITMLTTVLTG